MKILHINASDISGGAARAAYRIHRCLLERGHAHGLESSMRVMAKWSDDPSVVAGMPAVPRSLGRRVQRDRSQRALRAFQTGNPTLHSLAWASTGLGAEIDQLVRTGGADLIHLHWLGDGTLSIGEIGGLPQSVVWTLHDQWAFCGAEHYTSPPGPGGTASSDERFALGYTPGSRPSHERGPDINRRTWLSKHKAWRRSFQIVCPSTWMADCARRSALMADWPITVIPHPLDLAIWAPWHPREARALLRLPLDRPLVMFGAVGGTHDPRKGADLLLQSLQLLRTRLVGDPLGELELVVFGETPPARSLDLGFPIHFLGHVSDDLRLRLLYAAADVMVVPSWLEAYGQTAAEAHACGTPVVAFRTGGLVDIVEDRVTGALASPFDSASLAAAIHWVLEDPSRHQQLGAAARQRAERLWDPERVAGIYAEVYAQVVATS